MPDGLVYVTNDDDRWGAGKGAVATASEVDRNFWSLHQRLTLVEETPRAGVSVQDVVLDETGTALRVLLTDGAIKGPFPLPTAEFGFREAWQNGAIYFRNDIVPVPDAGLFLVLRQHQTPALPAPFNPLATDGGGNPLYRQIYGVPPVLAYDLAFAFLGEIPAEGRILSRYLVPLDRDFRLKAGLAGSFAHLGVATSTATIEVSILKNTAPIGLIRFTPGMQLDGLGGQFGTLVFDADADFHAMDRLALMEPEAEDETAADLTATLVAQRL
jgi:hypothetical protein